MIDITAWYLERHLQLPENKHWQYIRVTKKLRRQHNEAAIRAGMETM